MTPTGSVSVACVPSSVSLARRRFLGDVSDTLPQRLRDDAVLVLSELLSNALRHAQPRADGSVRVSWALDGHGVEIAVTDGGASTRPSPMHPSLSALGGRGLAIVSTLTDDWGVSDAEDDVTVWARVASPAPHLVAHG